MAWRTSRPHRSRTPHGGVCGQIVEGRMGRAEGAHQHGDGEGGGQRERGMGTHLDGGQPWSPPPMVAGNRAGLLLLLVRRLGSSGGGGRSDAEAGAS
jgi:hypothetical protein